MTVKLAEWMWTIIDEAFEYSNRYKDIIPADKSLLDFCHEQIEKTNFTQEEKDACIEFSRFWGAYVGDPIERQSLKFFCLEECIEGSKYLSRLQQYVTNLLSQQIFLSRRPTKIS
jgi:hypothetical protein